MKIKKWLALAMAITLFAAVTASCARNATPAADAVEGITTFSNYNEIHKLIQKSIQNSQTGGTWMNRFSRMLTGLVPSADMAQEGALDDQNSKSSATGGLEDYSKTNLQVEGVDEADMVKTDGRYLYILANGFLVIVDAADPESMQIVSNIQYYFPEDQDKNILTPVEMFLDETNNHIILVNYTYDDRLAKALMDIAESKENFSDGREPAITTDSIAPSIGRVGFYWGYQNVSVQVIDLKDITSPQIIREFVQEGSYVSSRRINEFVYLVTNKYLFYGEIEDNDLLIPATRNASQDEEWVMVSPEDIVVLDQADHSNFLIVSGIHTVSPDVAPDTKAILGAGQNVYSSPTNLYIASSRYEYDDSSQTAETDAQAATGTTGEKDQVVTNDNSDEKTDNEDEKIFPDTFKIYEPPVYSVFTDLFRFEISQGTVTPKGAGEVPGYILNQFSMDEYEGYFRIATTTGDTWREDEFTSMNNLYILNQEMTIIGKVEGLATRETIRSVRFMGEKAYMVTFRTTDPLFVLDLSDPTAPTVKGELKIPGYSQYLHPISDTILIGFGRQTIEEGDRAVEKGLKVSVFDVSDMEDPREISVFIIGDSGTYSEVVNNHKSLLYSKEKNILGFPVTIYEINSNPEPGWYYYSYPTFSGFIILGLDENNHLYEKGRVSHADMEALPENLTEKQTWAYFDRMYQSVHLYSVKRGMYIGDVLYTVSDAFIKATNLSDYETIGSVELPGFKEINQYYFEPIPSDGDDGSSRPKDEDPSLPGQTEPGFPGEEVSAANEKSEP